MTARSILILQSHPSGFCRSLLKEFEGEDVACKVVNFSLSDWYFRFGTGAVNYFGRLKKWQDKLETLIVENDITDIIYYADRRPYHRVAHDVAMRRGINTFAYEFGYMRPDWITLERGGMGVYSHYPNDPLQIRSSAADLPELEAPGPFPHSFLEEAVNEVICNLIPVFFPYLFPFYQRDRYYHPFRDYFSYIPRLIRQKRLAKEADETISALVRDKTEYFVVPMQMQGDYQIRHHSRYKHLSSFIRELYSSFSANSDAGSKLVFKLHPFDNNVEKWPKVIRQIAEEFRCLDRTLIIDGGDLNLLLRHSRGCVLVNSTVGMEALKTGVPVKPMGIAIYDIAGLTDQGTLDNFWEDPLQPDSELYHDLEKLMGHTIQIHGSFYNLEGRRIAAKEFVKRILEDRVNGHGTFVEVPPRLATAKAAGVPIPADCYWSDK
ncbi:Capsule polysaccharide biosynthesis protein [Pseudovibrio axinellae]|uniref:Capsule polysaccharide biosynthesis protein n=1 Tax=Pseudovibrio axinellae TaxID=989403 RepID=A0A165W8G4_9HYPH|nr:capsular biosynthesis protein [Pseudovibrio axinellae]KZL16187.1 Capsule polysaccharide biosynthesis protein [Pseudovibrio axinellae]SER76248.1 capsular polysaccharide export protein [Pseudovibrio axinellae]